VSDWVSTVEAQKAIWRQGFMFFICPQPLPKIFFEDYKGSYFEKEMWCPLWIRLYKHTGDRSIARFLSSGRVCSVTWRTCDCAVRYQLCQICVCI